MSELGSPIGPILRAVIGSIWKRVFDPAAPIYLPTVIRDGYAPWNLPSYDPAYPSGVSDAFDVPGVPQEVADSACTADVPISPVATRAPQLRLLNVAFRNLSVMRPKELTFSSTDPQFTARVYVGTAGQRFTLEAAKPEEPNYLFEVGCCEPVRVGTRECGDHRWDADARGVFTATAYDAVITLVLRLDVPSSGPATVTVVSLDVEVEAGRVEVDFDVKGLPEWAQEMAQIAVREGVGNGALVGGLNNFLNQRDVKDNIEKLVNEQLKKIPGEDGR